MPPIYEYRKTLLKVDDVSVAMGGTPILRDINVEVRDVVRPNCVTGQVVGLLGPSGIGKTTLFRVLAGLSRPDSGSVRIGEDAVPVERGMVGVVAQNYPLFSHRTVLGNLIVAAKQAGLSGEEARKKGLEILDRFGLGARADVYPAQLSGGQRQRVAIAQQFLCSEHFLLLDEPFSGLDLIAKEKVVELLVEVANLHELNVVIVVTHDIPAALEVADTLWLMGRDRDAQGNIVPGARIVATYDLAERDLCWRKGLALTPEFADMVREIRSRFPSL